MDFLEPEKPMKTIPLHNGMVAIVDDEDYETLAFGRAWQAQKSKTGFYAARSKWGKAKSTKEYMHRTIMRAKKGQYVDHISGNGLDNRKANMRLCSNQENSRNQRKRAGSSAYKGVSWYKKRQCWRAHIVVDNRQLHLGYHPTEIEAAVAYDAAAAKLFGDFARTNGVRG